MSVRPAALATSIELGLILAGLALLWQFVLCPAARAQRPAPRLAEWTIPGADFVRFLFVVVCCSLVGNFAATLLLKLRPLAGDPKVMFLTACSHAGMLAGIAIFKFGVERVPLASAVMRAGDFVSGAITFLVALPVVTAANLAWHWLLEAGGLHLEKQDLVGMFVNARSPLLLALMIGLATVTAPATEELVFRAGFFRYVRTRIPRWAALVAPACLFAALHQNLASFAPLVVLGVAFSLAYEHTGRIGTTIVAHALFNLHTIALIFAGVGV